MAVRSRPGTGFKTGFQTTAPPVQGGTGGDYDCRFSEEQSRNRLRKIPLATLPTPVTAIVRQRTDDSLRMGSFLSA